MPTPNVINGTVWGFPVAVIDAFRETYWLSLPPEVRALRTTDPNVDPSTGTSPRVELAKQLAQQGQKIDLQIMVWGEDPYIKMFERAMEGFSYAGSAFMEQGGGSGPVPAGAIKVSYDPADYPAFDPPKPPDTSGFKLVGPGLGFQIDGKDVFSVTKDKTAIHPPHFTEGFPHSEDGASYLYHMLGNSLMNPADRVGVWLKAS